MDSRAVLIVDDDENICDLLDIYVSSEGFDVTKCRSGEEALDAIVRQTVDLVLLDVMMPGMDGWETLANIRKTSDIPVIMLTARDMMEDKLRGFSLGADDYIVKPFEAMEVVARVKARLKDHKAASNERIINVHNLSLDLSRYEVRVGDTELMLKPKEIKLLQYMLTRPDEVLTRLDLLKNVWDYSFLGETRTVDMHIKRLREKLESVNAPVKIQTVWGMGYKLQIC